MQRPARWCNNRQEDEIVQPTFTATRTRIAKWKSLTHISALFQRSTPCHNFFSISALLLQTIYVITAFLCSKFQLQWLSVIGCQLFTSLMCLAFCSPLSWFASMKINDRDDLKHSIELKVIFNPPYCEQSLSWWSLFLLFMKLHNYRTTITL